MMNTHKLSRTKSGFTLVELLVAMSITVILLGILVYMTGISMDTYSDSRKQVRASRQGQEAINEITKDFESMVTRRDGGNIQWLYAGPETINFQGPAGKEITNTSQVIFFTSAADRYNGDIGSADDAGGDISAVSYRLVYRDQIAGSDDAEHAVFALYRNLIDPDDAFDLLGNGDLLTDYTAKFNDAADLDSDNFLVDNIYEFSLTFIIEVIDSSSGVPITHTVRATVAPNSSLSDIDEFIITSLNIQYNGTIEIPSGSGLTQAQIAAGSIAGVDISITVLSDEGLTLAKRTPITREELINKHGFHYSKRIITPRP